MKTKASVEDVQRDLITRIQTEGVLAAYEASLAVCKNPEAPAPARATASATLFRVAGYFNSKEHGAVKQPHEMTPDELKAEIARLGRRSQEAVPGDVTDSIFD